MSLNRFFNATTAIVFFDVTPNNDRNKLFKVVSYIPTYDPNLSNASWGGAVLPYRELYSTTTMQGTKAVIKTFRGYVSDFPNFGANPVPTATAAEKVNPFAGNTNFPDGVSLQFAILPYANKTKVGDIVGAVHVWADSGTSVKRDDSLLTPSLTIPIYQAGTEIPLFQKAPNLTSTAHYVATLGTKPFYKSNGLG